MTTLVVCAPELRLDLTGFDSHEMWQNQVGKSKTALGKGQEARRDNFETYKPP